MGPAPGQAPARPTLGAHGDRRSAHSCVHACDNWGNTDPGQPATPTPAPHPTVAPPVLQEAVTLTVAIAPIHNGHPCSTAGQSGSTGRTHDGDCQNARHEVLIEPSPSNPVTYKTDRKCRVESRPVVRSLHRDLFRGPRGRRRRPYGPPEERPQLRRVGLGPGHERGVRQQPGRRRPPDRRGKSTGQPVEGRQRVRRSGSPGTRPTGASTPRTGRK